MARASSKELYREDLVLDCIDGNRLYLRIYCMLVPGVKKMGFLVLAYYDIPINGYDSRIQICAAPIVFWSML